MSAHTQIETEKSRRSGQETNQFEKPKMNELMNGQMSEKSPARRPILKIRKSSDLKLFSSFRGNNKWFILMFQLEIIMGHHINFECAL